jgi:nitrile hydratase accessory protein
MPEPPSIDPDAGRRAAETVPGIPRDADGPVFRAPWEAHAFAMALALYQKGLFAWSEWAAMLGEEIKKAQAAGDPDTGETYYHHWLVTLERMVAEKGLAAKQSLAEHYDAWERAMHRTPHGEPIELRPGDFRK